MTHFPLKETGIIQSEIAEDQNGEFGLYIIPKDQEICITESELREALQMIEASK